MKLKHSDIDYIGQILDDVLYENINESEYFYNCNNIIEQFKLALQEKNGERCETCIHYNKPSNLENECKLHGYYCYNTNYFNNMCDD